MIKFYLKKEVFKPLAMLLLMLCNITPASANSDDPIINSTNFMGWTYTTDSVIWLEDFSLNNGTTNDTGSTSWSLQNSAAGTFSVQNNELKVSFNSTNEGIWKSGVIDISSWSNVSISALLRSETSSSFESEDFIKVAYILNGGSEQTFFTDTSGLGSTSTGVGNATATATQINGQTLQIIVRFKNSASDEKYFLDDVKLSGLAAGNTIWYENFSLSNGTTNDTGVTSWSLQNSAAGTFSVQNNELKASFNSTNEGIWKSGVINISCQPNVKISALLRSETSSSFESEDFIKVAYILNGGAEQTFFTDTSGLGSTSTGVGNALASSSELNGQTLQVIVRFKNSASDEKYFLDDVKVTSSATGTGSIVATAVVEGALSCGGSNVIIRGGSSVSNVSYLWTGPNAFSANTQDITVNTAGTYTLTITNSSGCSGTTSVVVASSSGGANQTVWLENFNDLANGTKVDTGATAWSIDASGIQNGLMEVIDNKFVANGSSLDSSVGIGLWSSEIIDISSLTDVQISLDAEGIGSLDSGEDYFRVYYKIGTGNEIMFANEDGDGAFSLKNYASPLFNGNTVQIIIRTKSTGDSEFYFFDNIKVTGTGAANIVATAEVVGTLSCANSQVTINGSSSIAGVTYSWSGPNGYTSSDQNIMVSTAGNYTLTVTNSICTNSTTVTVNTSSTGGTNQTVWLETFNDLANGTKVDTGATAWSIDASGIQNGLMEVIDNKFVANGSSLDSSVGIGLWSSEIIDISSLTDVQISLDAEGIGSLDSGEDYFRVYYKIGTGNEIMFANEDGDGAFSLKNYASPLFNGNTVQIIIRTKSTGDSEFYFFDNIKVTGTGAANIVATAEVVGTLSCANSQVTINGSSSIAGASYSWSGPNGFTSSDQNIMVSTAGNYTLTVTNSTCTNSTTVAVSYVTGETESIVWLEDFSNLSNGTKVDTGSTAWTSANASGSGKFEVDSNKFLISDTGSGNQGVWSSGIINIENLTKITISADISSSGAMENSGSSLDYLRLYYKLNGQTETLFSESLASINGNEGAITVSAENLNGTTLQILARSTTTDPTEIYYLDNIEVKNTVILEDIQVETSVSGIINCATEQVQITANTTTPNVTYSWTGPNGFASNQQNITVNTEGDYTVTVTSATGGCTSTSIAQVTKEDTKPIVSINASNNGVIDCNFLTAELTASSNVTGAFIRWEGFPINQNPISVSDAGTYTVFVENQDTGCITEAFVTVTKQNTKPIVSINASNNGVIDCNFLTAELTASSNVTGAFIRWEGFPINQNPISVSDAGTYTVFVENQDTGCITEAFVTVTKQDTKPIVSINASNNGVIDCNFLTAELTASSNVTGAFIRWEGFPINQNPISVSDAGTYTVFVENQDTGCITEAFVTVTKQDTKPIVSINASNNGVIDCNFLTAELTASSNVTGAFIRWEGFPINQNPISVSDAGTYTVFVENQDTGCITEAFVTVTKQDTKPIVSINASNNGVIDCNFLTAELTASSNVTGAFIRWEGFPINQNPISVSDAGTYTVFVENQDTGCITEKSFFVDSICDIVASSVSASSSSSLVSVASVTEDTPFEALVFPNPSKGEVNISFKSSKSENIRVEVYSPTGVLVRTLMNDKMDSLKNYNLKFNENRTLPSGMYICYIILENKTIVKKIILSN
ncbi:T9SS type A sorting domain-containing protein [Mariniflexile litorale]|uniref:T9SS type A sorting domain-containing protein n=1 Tax=Mariniflexile litorale TaxID=3045158 RepID=A0AAU7EK43_9FLAO